MKAKLFAYDLSKLSQYQKVRVNRALFGYIDNSNKNSYHYRRKGVIEDIPHLKISKGVIIVRDQDKEKISSILKEYKVKYLILNVMIKSSMLH
jgi:hypothetical protein